MKWKIIRNRDNEIIKYQLTENIYIDRDYCKNFNSTSTFINTLVVNNKNIMSTAIGTGYKLKDLKLKGEEYLKNKGGK